MLRAETGAIRGYVSLRGEMIPTRIGLLAGRGAGRGYAETRGDLLGAGRGKSSVVRVATVGQHRRA